MEGRKLKTRIGFILICLWLIASIDPSRAEDYSNRKVVLKTLDYELNYRLDYEEKKLFCDGKMTVSNPSDNPVDQIPLLLYRLMKITSLKDENGNTLPFTQKVVSFSDWEQRQVNFVEVASHSRINKGETFTLHFQYEGYLYGYTEAMRYVKDHIDPEYTVLRTETFAYPVVGYPSWRVNQAAGFQKFDYLIRVTVPDTLVVANGGKLADKTVENGLSVYTYRNLKPAWRIDAAIARYDVLESGKNKIYYFPEDSSGARRAMAALEKTLALFTGWFGPVQDYHGFAIIEVPEGYGSQADVTAILQTANTFKNPDHLYGLYHEISHQWNVKSADAAPARFESEGLAMFLQHKLQERFENKSDAVEKAFTKYTERLCRMVDKTPKMKDIPMIDHGKEDITDLSYTKGMLMFTILYELVGEEAFNRMMGSFYQKYYIRQATSDEFVEHCKNLSAFNLNRFFQDWVYTAQSWEYICNRVPLEEMVEKYRKALN
jgi:hypothetical protein